MRRAVVAIALAAASRAWAEPPSRALAARSTTLSFGSELSTLPTITSHVGFDAWLRVVRAGGLAVTPRLGAEVAFSTAGGGALYGAHGGIGAGWSFAVGCRSVVTPSLGYDLDALWDDTARRLVLVHRGTVEVAWSFVVYPHVVLEPFVAAGYARVGGVRDLALAAGPRIGIAF